jgi:hypothetical protein
MTNNLISSASFYSASSALSIAPVTNTQEQRRSKLWIPQGYFFVTTGIDDKIYFNDGANKSATITGGAYTSPAALVTEIQTQMNAVSSNWVVSFTTEFKFQITRSAGNAILRTSVTTTAIWDLIGFNTGADRSSLPFLADEQRNHSEEWFLIDFGVITAFDFVGIVAPIDETFGLSSTATVRVQANNVNVWTAPPLDELVSDFDERGLFHFVQAANNYYRYVRWQYVDKFNPLGNQGLGFGYIYIGNYSVLDSSNIARGFVKQMVDPTKSVVSASGAQYFDTRTPYQSFNSMQIQLPDAAERLELEQAFRDFSVHTPMFISLDPDKAISTNMRELTVFGFLQSPPTVTHVFLDYYNININFRESS